MQKTQGSTSTETKPTFREKHPDILMLCEPSFNTNGQSKLLIVLEGHCKGSHINRRIKVHGGSAKPLTQLRLFKKPFQSYACWKEQI